MPFVVESISADFNVVGNFQMEYSGALFKMFLKKKTKKSGLLSRKAIKIVRLKIYILFFDNFFHMYTKFVQFAAVLTPHLYLMVQVFC